MPGMTADSTSAGAPLRERVAEEVRVALTRRRMSAAALARQLGVSQTYIWRRLTGETAFDLDDLERIGDALGVPWVNLVPTTDVRSTEQATHGEPGPPVRPVDNRPVGGPGRGPGRVGRTRRTSPPMPVPALRDAA